MTLEDLRDADVRGKRVLVRVDYNVPLDERQQVTDDTRIRATLPTLEWLTSRGARVVLLSHLGRPKGKPVPEMSLRPAAQRLAQLVPQKVDFIGVTVGEQAEQATRELGDGDILLLENTRYLPGEEKDDPELARQMAALGDLFVNDAFGSAHRAHSSTAGVAGVIRARGGLAVAGLLMERELEYLGNALESPRRPFVAILGGAKISGKIDVIEALLPKVDTLLIGGAMANTFFRAMGLETGASLVEDDRVPMARDLLARAGDKIVLPTDVVIAERLEAGAPTRIVDRSEIPAGWQALDIGPASAARFGELVGSARTVLWNGPMGVFEIPEFRIGTEAVARALATATAGGAITVVGGGDSAAAISELGLADRVSHVSTGGGASLEFLEGRTLPGVAALSDAGGAR
ncbi:MAG TPA: phosphoglycerate kinase [Longimicrobiaceae bacterium]|nr:phosphoglycerate kinase [Longimicrobiaceae bacterium]